MAEVSFDVHKDSAFDVQIWINVVKITKTFPRDLSTSPTLLFLFQLKSLGVQLFPKNRFETPLMLVTEESQVSEELKPKSVF